MRRLSDTVCLEHGLSVIENPAQKGMTYDKWLGGSAKVSNREVLRKAIDDVITQNPRDMDEFLRLLEAKGFTAKRGKHVTLKYKDFKKQYAWTHSAMDIRKKISARYSLAKESTCKDSGQTETHSLSTLTQSSA